jgi:hypothetical protein
MAEDSNGNKALRKEREALQEASIALQAASEGDRLTAICAHESAKVLTSDAESERQLKYPVTIGAGGEVSVPSNTPNNQDRKLARETLLHPDAVSVGASAKRLQLLERAAISELAVDAAESISPENSLEKMLAHQLALCHDTAFKTLHQANERSDNPTDQTRLINSATRLLKCYQDGLMALHKIRSGNRQTMVVQHVNVSDGGQAVVTGDVGAHTRGSRKNDR